MPLLHPGDSFPELSLTVPDGQIVKVPETFDCRFGVLLFYRGSWCPYHNISVSPISASADQRAGDLLREDARNLIAGIPR